MQKIDREELNEFKDIIEDFAERKEMSVFELINLLEFSLFEYRIQPYLEAIRGV